MLLRALLGCPDPALAATGAGRGILLRLLIGETLPVLLRSLRLVRLLEHVEGLSVMAHAIWRSLPACGAVMAMLLGNMVIFAIFGMNLFMGTMHTCSYDKTLDHTQCECSGNGVMVDATGAAQPKAWGLGPWTDKNDAVDWQSYLHQRNRFVAALLSRNLIALSGGVPAWVSPRAS